MPNESERWKRMCGAKSKQHWNGNHITWCGMSHAENEATMKIHTSSIYRKKMCTVGRNERKQTRKQNKINTQYHNAVDLLMQDTVCACVYCALFWLWERKSASNWMQIQHDEIRSFENTCSNEIRAVLIVCSHSFLCGWSTVSIQIRDANSPNVWRKYDFFFHSIINGDDKFYSSKWKKERKKIGTHLRVHFTNFMI